MHDYAISVDPTVRMPLNEIATEQTKTTENTQAAPDKLLDYLAMHPDTTIRYHASDMILHIHNDASYLSVSNAYSIIWGIFFVETSHQKKPKSMVPFLTQLPSSRTWLRHQHNQK
jgi:hypothetical protein